MKQIVIPWSKPLFFGNEKEYLLHALDSTWVSGGQYVEKFEEECRRRLGSEYGSTTCNGTAALLLAITALGIASKDEVIVPGFTFVAPVNMVIAAGALPVYADIDPLTWCIDPDSVEENITSKTRAIIAVHVYGNVCDMDTLKGLAEKYRLCLIEDTAEAAFSAYKEKYAGTFADAGCFSFQAAKTITTGEGGFVATPFKELHEKMRIIRDHGMNKDRRYWHDGMGYNFRLTNLQAAVGCGQLDNLEIIVSGKQRVYKLYSGHLANEAGITLQHFNKEVKPVVWATAVKIDPVLFKGDRDFLIQSLSERGIETRPGFYPLSAMPFYNAPSLAISEDIGPHVITLPSFGTLTEDEIAYVCKELKKLRK